MMSRNFAGVMQTAQKARQVLAACEKSPTDAAQLNYDPLNPFDICSITFTPIYRGNKCARCLPSSKLHCCADARRVFWPSTILRDSPSNASHLFAGLCRTRTQARASSHPVMDRSALWASSHALALMSVALCAHQRSCDEAVMPGSRIVGSGCGEQHWIFASTMW